MGPAIQQRAPDGHVGRGDRIVRGGWTDAEAVEDDEDDRSRPRRGRARHGGSGERRGHAIAARRAAAATPARPTIPAISSGFSEAPPTSAPSIEGSPRNSPMFAAVTLPP